MPLKVILRPGETMVLNGALIGAGDRTATIFLHNRAQFLRSRDMLHRRDIDGPERALYYAIQCRYLDLDETADVAAALKTARAARPDAASTLDAIAALFEQGRAYEALRACARLFPPRRS